MKNVLFITYYFPPSGGSGVQRGLKMVKYLTDFGWKPTVLTVDPEYASYPVTDAQLLEDIPDGVRVVRTKSRDPYAAYASWTGKKKSESVGVGFLGSQHTSWKERLARWVRANLFIPDARRGWARYAQKRAAELVSELQFDAIVSTGPPHSAHLISESLSRSEGIPWVADIRDAWPDVAYADLLPTTALARGRDIRMRNRVLKSASRRIAVTEDLASEMKRGVGADFEVIRNGFDPQDFRSLESLNLTGFTIVHTGSMAPARNPLPLWELLSEDGSRQRWPDLRLVLVGNVDSTIHDAASRAGVSDLVEHVPYVPHSQALQYTISASVLILPINRVSEAAGIVTGKIYEYLASSRPIIGLGDPQGEAAAILRESQSGAMFDYTDVDGLRDEIDRHYHAWRSGSPLNGASQSAAAPFSRREQSGQLAVVLDSLASEKTTALDASRGRQNEAGT